jgi:hypothetical protein
MSWQRIRTELLRKRAAWEPLETPILHVQNWIDEVGDDYVVVRSERTGRQRRIKANEIQGSSTPSGGIKAALRTLGECKSFEEG